MSNNLWQEKWNKILNRKNPNKRKAMIVRKKPKIIKVQKKNWTVKINNKNKVNLVLKNKPNKAIKAILKRIRSK